MHNENCEKIFDNLENVKKAQSFHMQSVQNSPMKQSDEQDSTKNIRLTQSNRVKSK